MDNQAMKRKIEETFNIGNMEQFGREMYEMSADDIVQEWPQSGERIRGKQNVEAVNSNYPTGSGTNPTAKLRRVLAPDEAWVIESVIDYGDGVPVSAVSIIKTNDDGKIVHQRDYFAYPFEAPEWRKQWVEQMEKEPMPVG